jgi:DNA mismatch repair ATPase MutL
MPTFSFPSSTTEQMVDTPKPKNKRSKKEKIVATKDAETNEQTTEATVEAEATLEAEATAAVHPKSPDHRHTDGVNDKPTFPDVVILKQTDKNYIVKHNHYPLHVQDVNSINEHGVAVVSKRASITSVSEDLVSPNQIHKGQINKKRG